MFRYKHFKVSYDSKKEYQLSFCGKGDTFVFAIFLIRDSEWEDVCYKKSYLYGNNINIDEFSKFVDEWLSGTDENQSRSYREVVNRCEILGKRPTEDDLLIEALRMQGWSADYPPSSWDIIKKEKLEELLARL